MYNKDSPIEQRMSRRDEFELEKLEKKKLELAKSTKKRKVIKKKIEKDLNIK